MWLLYVLCITFIRCAVLQIISTKYCRKLEKVLQLLKADVWIKCCLLHVLHFDCFVLVLWFLNSVSVHTVYKLAIAWIEMAYKLNFRNMKLPFIKLIIVKDLDHYVISVTLNCTYLRRVWFKYLLRRSSRNFCVTPELLWHTK